MSEHNMAGMGGVPEDLQRWFGGRGILRDRHNLPRFEPRWRVVEVEAVLGEEATNPWIVKGEHREFKTLESAHKLRDKWAREGRTVLVQFGFTFWLDPNEVPKPPQSDDAGSDA